MGKDKSNTILNAWISYLAAKMYLHIPDNDYLREISSNNLKMSDDLSKTSEMVASYGKKLPEIFKDEKNRNDKLVKLCRIFSIKNILDIDLLVFSLLPFYDERFKSILHILSGSQNLQVSSVVPILLSDKVHRELILEILSKSCLWNNRLLLANEISTNRFELPLIINPIVVNYLLIDNGYLPAHAVYRNKKDVEKDKLSLIKLIPSVTKTVDEIRDYFDAKSSNYIHVISADNERLKLILESLRDQFNGLTVFHLSENNSEQEIIDAALYSNLKESMLVIDAREVATLSLPDNWLPTHPVVIFSKLKFSIKKY